MSYDIPEFKCHWERDELHGNYNTQCENLFEFTEGTPKENHFKFCPYCGAELVEYKKKKP